MYKTQYSRKYAIHMDVMNREVDAVIGNVGYVINKKKIKKQRGEEYKYGMFLLESLLTHKYLDSW